jgi:hypothetical protein
MDTNTGIRLSTEAPLTSFMRKEESTMPQHDLERSLVIAMDAGLGALEEADAVQQARTWFTVLIGVWCALALIFLS